MVKIDKEDNGYSFRRANKCTKGDIIGEHSTSPWQYFLQAPTEEILERLQFADYFRFGAVCKAWHSKQISHRLSFWPLSPPMSPPLPWLVPSIYNLSHKTLDCYSVLERRTYHLSLISGPSKTMKVFASSFGWLLLLKGMCDKAQLLLYNPVTKDRILIPQISHFQYKKVHFGQLSSSPVDSNCIVLLVNGRCFYLYRLNDGFRVRFETPEFKTDFSAAVYCNGKFYCKGLEKLFVIDPTFPMPTFSCLKMDIDICTNYFTCGHCGLVGSKGELFLYAWEGKLIITNNNLPNYSVKDNFKVFNADICEQRWIEVESIGSSSVLFVHGSKGLMLSLGNDNIGLRHDCVYFSRDVRVGDDVLWNVYDLKTKSLTLGTPLPCINPMKSSIDGEEWFLPSLSSTLKPSP